MFALAWLKYFSLDCRKMRRFCTSRSPTHPVVREIVQDQSGAEGASGIDAASRVADLEGAKDSCYIDAAAAAGSGCVVVGGGNSPLPSAPSTLRGQWPRVQSR